jgi:hypothetical protein
METSDYAAMVSRVCPQEADNLDPLIDTLAPRSRTPGADLFPEIEAVSMPEVRFRVDDAVTIGVMVRETIPNAADMALRLAAMAFERDAEVVILSAVDLCGLERFGFRVERMAGETHAARAACVDQVRRFWNIDLVI